MGRVGAAGDNAAMESFTPGLAFRWPAVPVRPTHNGR